jgi:hypothetical protein
MEMLGNIFEGFEYYIVILGPIFYDKFFFGVMISKVLNE